MVKVITDLELCGGRPSLDFVNTEGGERNGPPEWLESYEDLLRWAVYAESLDPDEADRLIEAGTADPAGAARVFERAVALREALFRMLDSVRAGRPTADQDREVFDRELARALANLEVVPDGGRFAWRFGGDPDALDRVLWPLIHDAAELLSSDELARLKGCDGPRCSWLFVDVSRNRSRRWCKMGDCGNRAKARRYYRRHKAAKESPA